MAVRLMKARWLLVKWQYSKRAREEDLRLLPPDDGHGGVLDEDNNVIQRLELLIQRLIMKVSRNSPER